MGDSGGVSGSRDLNGPGGQTGICLLGTLAIESSDDCEVGGVSMLPKDNGDVMRGSSVEEGLWGSVGRVIAIVAMLKLGTRSTKLIQSAIPEVDASR